MLGAAIVPLNFQDYASIEAPIFYFVRSRLFYCWAREMFDFIYYLRVNSGRGTKTIGDLREIDIYE